MSGIQSHGEIGPAAFFVSGVDDGVKPLFEVRADRRHEMPARREAQHADLLRINMPFGSVKADQSDRSLSIV